VSGPPYAPVAVTNAHRERVVDLLSVAFANHRLTIEQLDQRLAAVYAAPSLADLELLLADPAEPQRSLAEAPTLTANAAVVPERGLALAIMGGFGSKGGWLVPRHLKVTGIMGGGELDLREARFAPGVTEIEVYAFMGGVDLIVPDGVRIELSGVGFLGGFEQRGGDIVDDPAAPVLRITGAAVLGAVEISRKPRAKKSDRRYVDALERAERLRPRGW
jgi:hypothetical protein